MKITTNYYNYATRTSKTTPNFKGGLSDSETSRILRLLQNKLTDVQDCENMKDFKGVTDRLFQKYKPYGIDSIGAMIIPEKQLAEFLGEKANQFDLTNKRGICVAVGDKKAPIEYWGNAYESVLALCPKHLFQ